MQALAAQLPDMPARAESPHLAIQRHGCRWVADAPKLAKLLLKTLAYRLLRDDMDVILPILSDKLKHRMAACHAIATALPLVAGVRMVGTCRLLCSGSKHRLHNRLLPSATGQVMLQLPACASQSGTGVVCCQTAQLQVPALVPKSNNTIPTHCLHVHV